MPSSQTSREERHTGWLEFNGDSRKFDGNPLRFLTITTGNSARLPAPGLSVSTRNGAFIAICVGDAVTVKKWEWYWEEEGGEATPAVQRGWLGMQTTPPVPRFDDRPPIVAQVWLSEDAKTLAALAIDQDDFSNRELYFIGRGSPTAAWPAQWKRKPELKPPHKSKGLNLSAQELFLGRMLVEFVDTPQTGRCCLIAHVYRRVEEFDEHRSVPPQLIVEVRAMCIKVAGSSFSNDSNLELQSPNSWMALEQPLNIGSEDVVSPPLIARMDPNGSVLAVAANHAAGTPLLFVGMPGFEVRSKKPGHCPI
jgi:hypothetical protein